MRSNFSESEIWGFYNGLELKTEQAHYSNEVYIFHGFCHFCYKGEMVWRDGTTCQYEPHREFKSPWNSLEKTQSSIKAIGIIHFSRVYNSTRVSDVIFWSFGRAYWGSPHLISSWPLRISTGELALNGVITCQLETAISLWERTVPEVLLKSRRSTSSLSASAM